MIDVNFDIQFEHNFIDVDKLKELVQYVCRDSGVDHAVINILVVDNQAILKANRDYLDHDYITDVISFDMTDDSGRDFDIIVNGELAETKAEQMHHKPLAELSLYITHGLLHNLGYDDSDEQKAEKMHKKEDEILNALGYGCIYNSNEKDK